MKRLILGFGLASCILASSAAFGGAQRTVSGNNWIGCITKDDYSRLVGFVVDKDQEAFAAMLMSGRCVPLKNGQTVYLEDTAIFSGMVAIRPKGSTRTLWTAIEATK